MRRFAVVLSLFMLVVLASALRSSADGPKILNSSVEGSIPNVTIRSITSGGAPWVIQEGKAQLDPSGRLRIRVRGLLIGAGALASGDPVPAGLVGTTAGIPQVHAALTCGGPGGGTPFTVVSTDPVPLNAHGDFQIDARITVPDICDHPVVLIRIGAPDAAGPFIAEASNTPRRDD